MFDARLRDPVDRVINPIARWVGRHGVSANHVTICGFGFGLLAMGAVMVDAMIAALVLLLMNRFCDGLDGAIARYHGATDFGGYLDIVLDFVFYSAIPFGFAVNNPENAVAASFLIFSFIGTGVSFLAFAILAEKRGISTDIRGKKSFYYLGGLIEGAETITLLVLMCLFPDWFAVLAWVFGCLCWITTATRIHAAAQIE